MSEPKVGDRVRVVIEGQVKYVDGDSFEVGPRGADNVIFPDAEHVVSVEILRPPVKVGDVIETAEELDALPHGAIVLNGSRCAAQRFYGKWFAAYSGSVGVDAGLPATVLYLPDGAA